MDKKEETIQEGVEVIELDADEMSGFDSLSMCAGVSSDMPQEDTEASA